MFQVGKILKPLWYFNFPPVHQRQFRWCLFFHCVLQAFYHDAYLKIMPLLMVVGAQPAWLKACVLQQQAVFILWSHNSPFPVNWLNEFFIYRKWFCLRTLKCKFPVRANIPFPPLVSPIECWSFTAYRELCCITVKIMSVLAENPIFKYLVVNVILCINDSFSRWIMYSSITENHTCS